MAPFGAEASGPNAVLQGRELGNTYGRNAKHVSKPIRKNHYSGNGTWDQNASDST